MPLVYVSVKLLPDIRPSDVRLEPEMQRTVMVCVVAVTLVGIGAVVERVNRRRRPEFEGRPTPGMRAA